MRPRYQKNLNIASFDTSISVEAAMRRRVLKSLTAATGLLLLPTTASAAIFERKNFDVVVVGAGGAGLAAAVSAAEQGLSVLVLEKCPIIGGNTLRASGLFNAADPDRQNPMGIEDSVEWHFEQTLSSSGGKSDPKVVRRFVEEALPTIHWLENFGMRFLPEVVTTWGAEWPRGHKPTLPRGQGYIRTLSGKLLELGGEIRTETMAVSLIRNSETGRIEGVGAVPAPGGRKSTIMPTEIRAKKAVILAAGGYSANRSLLEKFAPQYKDFPSDNAAGSTGEVIFAAEAIGAKLVNLDCVQTVPGAPAGRSFQVRLDLDSGRVILIDADGRRFVDEDLPRDRLSEAIIGVSGGQAFSITDNAAVNSYDLISKKDIYRGLRSGDAFRANSLEELAGKIGVPANSLLDSVRTFNIEAVVKSGKCGRIRCHPIDSKPFWASPIRLNVHSTMGGVAVDTSAAVLDENGYAIPGLFACGEMVGNLHGKNRIGGNGIGAALTMGRIAGLSAAEE